MGDDDGLDVGESVNLIIVGGSNSTSKPANAVICLAREPSLLLRKKVLARVVVLPLITSTSYSPYTVLDMFMSMRLFSFTSSNSTLTHSSNLIFIAADTALRITNLNESNSASAKSTP